MTRAIVHDVGDRWFLIDGARVQLSVDDGRTWALQDAQPVDQFVVHSSDGSLVVTSSSQLVWYTSDRVRWSTLPAPPKCHRAHLVDSLVGFAVNGAETVWRTISGGKASVKLDYGQTMRITRLDKSLEILLNQVDCERSIQLWDPLGRVVAEASVPPMQTTATVRLPDSRGHYFVTLSGHPKAVGIFY